MRHGRIITSRQESKQAASTDNFNFHHNSLKTRMFMVATKCRERQISCFLPLTKERIMANVVAKAVGKASRSGGARLANLNLKLTEDERWAFKEWCVKHRISQVDGFRRAFALLQKNDAEGPDGEE